MPQTLITKKNIAFIKMNRFRISGADMAKQFGVSKAVVNSYMRNHGLSVDQATKNKFKGEALRGRTTLTKQQEMFLLNNYLTTPIKQIGDKIGKSFTCLMKRLDQLGIVIPEEIRQSRTGNMYSKGHAPMNKGKKQSEYMSKAAINRTKKTRFKKGHLPHNAEGIKDGDIRIRHNHKDRNEQPYKWIRVSLGKWKMLHVVNWEKVNGPAPGGHIIIFKDGNTMNCAIENLQCITRVQHAANTRAKDEYIAKTMSMRKGAKGLYDKDLYAAVLQNKELIGLKRKSLELKRTIHEQKIS